MQCALLLSDGKLVGGQCEMVHADVEIARVKKAFEASAKNGEFLASLRKVRLK